MYHNFFIHSSVNGHLGCFYVLAIVNGAAVNAGVHVSFRIVDFSGYMPSSGIAGSYGSFIPSFLKRNLHIILHSGCIDLHSPNPLQCSCLENSRDGEPGGLPSMGLHRVGHDWSDLAAAAAAATMQRGSLLYPLQILLYVEIWWWPFWPVWGNTSL